MKLVELDQNTPEWLAWRANRIGASDSPIILDVSPYKTPLQLYREKKGEIENSATAFATSYGHALEPTALMFYERHTGLKMTATCAQNEKYPHLAASLDGWNSAKQIHVEIKCPGKKDMALADDGEIPYHYEIQIQHQLIVTGTKKAHYYAFDGTRGRLIVVWANKKLQQEIIDKTTEFRNMLRHENPPPLSDRDTKFLSSPDLMTLVESYRKTRELIEELNEKKGEIERELADKCDHPRCEIDGLRISKTTRRGVVSYKKLAEQKLDLDTLDLDEFRGHEKEIVYFKDKTNESRE